MYRFLVPVHRGSVGVACMRKVSEWLIRSMKQSGILTAGIYIGIPQTYGLGLNLAAMRESKEADTDCDSEEKMKGSSRRVMAVVIFTGQV